MGFGDDFYMDKPTVPRSQNRRLLTGQGISVLKEVNKTGGTVPDLSVLGESAVRPEAALFPRAVSEAERYGPVTGFFASAASSAGPEFFFQEPLAGVEEWRAEHPVAGVASSLVGDIATYTAGAAVLPGVLAKTPLTAAKYAKWMKRINMMDAGFAKSGLSAMAQLAPLEALRLGTNTASAFATGEPDKLSNVGKQITMDMLFTGALGGVAGFVRSVRPTTRLEIAKEELVQRTLGDYSVGMKPQEKIQKISVLKASERWATLTPEEQHAANSVLHRVKQEVVEQVPIKGKQAHVGALVGGEAKPINELMTPKTGPNVSTLFISPANKLSPVKRDLGFDDVAWKEVQTHLLPRLPQDYEGLSQFGRVVVANTDDGATSIATKVQQNFSIGEIAEGTWLGREAGEDGLYIIASRVNRPTIWKSATEKVGSAPKKGDMWMIIKTANPAAFHPDAAAYGGAVLQHNYRFALPGLDKSLRGVPMAQFIDDLDRNIYPLEAVRGTATYGKPGRLAGRVLNAETASDLTAAKEMIGESLRRVTAPQDRRFINSPHTQRMFEIMRRSFQESKARADELMYGQKVKPKVGTNLFWDMAKGQHDFEGGMFPLIKAMEADGDDALIEVSAAIRTSMSPTEARKAGFHPSVVNFLKEANRVDMKLANQTKAVVEATLDDAKFDPLPFHYGISRTWRGSFRAAVTDEQGKVIGYGSGVRASDAAKEADELVKAGEEIGVALSYNRNQIRGYDPKKSMDLVSTINSPYSVPVNKKLADKLLATKGRALPTFRTRRGTRGFVGDIRPLTAKELEDSLLGHYQTALNMQTENILRDKVLKSEIKRITGATMQDRGEFPEMGAAIQRSLTIGSGNRTAFSAMQDEGMDHLFGGVLGKDSASQLVDAFNAATFQLTLGALDTGFPAMNAMTWIQTILPEAALVLNSTDETLMKYYGFSPIVGSKTGMHSVGWFDPLRVAGQAAKLVAKPDDEFLDAFRWAVRLSVPNPRFTEEVVGRAASGIRESFKASDWLGVMKGISAWMPARTEEISRLHAFGTGYILGRDFRGLQGQKLYEFAKKFTERTMYNYATIDRPAFTTTPAGRLFGMFKTWTTNYLWNAGLYAQEGFQKNNWAPFVWMVGGTGALAGAGGVPGYFIADKASRILSDKSLMENMYDLFDNDVSDVMLYGLPAIFGTTVGGRGDAPGADMMRDLGAYMSVASWRRAQDIWKFGGDVTDRWASLGEHPASNKAIWDQFTLAFLPRTAQRYAQVVGQDGLRSLRSGNTVIGQMDLVDKVIYGATGFMPVELERAFAVDREQWTNINTRRERVSVLGEDLANARLARDQHQIHMIRKRAFELQLHENVERSAIANMRGKVRPAVVRRTGKLPENRRVARTVLGSE